MTDKDIGKVLKLMKHKLGADERSAVLNTVIFGQVYGYGNMMAWLATAWAMKQRSDGIQEPESIFRVSPYPLPPDPHSTSVASTPEKP